METVEYASYISRFWANFIDFIVILYTMYGFENVISSKSVVFWTVFIFTCYLGYFVLFENHKGFTPGKWILGIRVCNLEGNLPSLKQALIRNLIRIIDFLPLCYCLGGFVYLVTEKHQRLGDIFAETIVVRRK